MKFQFVTFSLSLFSIMVRITKKQLFVNVMFMWARCDGFKTITELQTLIQTQENVVHDLDVYISQEKKRLKCMKRYLRKLKVNKIRLEASSNFLKNPLNVVMMLKRLTIDYTAMTRRRKTSAYYRNVSFTYPSRKDYEAAVIDFSHLVNFYNLNLTHLVRGKLSGNYSYTKEHYVGRFTPLTAGDCYDIGQALMTMDQFDYALKWNLEALDLFSYRTKDHKTYGIKLQDIVSMIAECFHAKGDNTTGFKWSKITNSQSPKAMEWLKKNRKQVVARIRGGQAKKEKSFLFEEKELLKGSKDIPIGNKHILHTMTLFKHLCKGETDFLKDTSKHHRLSCSYLHGAHPYLRLARIEVEHLFTEPSVVLFRRVITDSEIGHLMGLAKTCFRHSAIGSRKIQINSRGDESFRISSSAWLGDTVSPVIEKLSRRVGYLTGLDARYSERFQVTEYGPGGRYLPHFDWSTKPDDINSTAGRLATVIFYLSEPTLGGSTAFPELGLTVHPEKGSALMWINLRPNGLMDPAMLHGGCPVLRGSKWVANKWITRIGQELVSPCPASHNLN